MASKVLLFLTLLGSVYTDRLRFHLENLVDRNVSACDDFYHHVCSQQADPREFFIHRSTAMLNEAIIRLHPEAIKHSPIEYDLQLTRNDNISKAENNYEQLIRSRCKDDIDCYAKDQEFYKLQMEMWDRPFNLTDNANATSEMIIDNLIKDTSKILDDIIDYINSPAELEIKSLFNTSRMFHAGLQTRIRLIEFAKINNTFSDFHDIKDASEIIKKKMIANMNNTKWLHGDEISEFIRLKIMERIASIEVFHDFDECDKNITTLQKLIRDLNSAYFSAKSETGIARLDTLLRLNYAYEKLVVINPEMKEFIFRVVRNFQFGAWFYSDLKAITIHSPFLHRSVFQSDILKEPFITYHVLGHELYHSLFSHSTPTLLKLFSDRSQCIVDHYTKSCSKFALGACASGHQTLTEDGPDLESWRASYSILTDRYSDTDLNTRIDGMETTLEQSFFYYVSSIWCAKDEIRTKEEATNVHSAENIRINAALSLMPEFTRAFGCKKDDAMFVEEKDSCYVFGPKSGE